MSREAGTVDRAADGATFGTDGGITAAYTTPE